MVNKRLLDQIISILMIIDIFLGIFFLAFLLSYTLSDGGGFILSDPLVYVTIVCLFLIPTSYIIYYLVSSKVKKDEYFIFNRDSYLKVKNLRQTEQDKEKIRFSNLYEIDNTKRENIVFDSFTSFKDFCDDFRNYCAANLNLYYEENDIRSFVANLASSKLMILQGMSGTGKTSIALAFEKFIGNLLEPIAIQPMWKERSDLVGYFNEFTKKFNETLLLEELYKATYDDKIYIIILDEVNIARIEYYFAEFLSLLEYHDDEQRKLEISNDSWVNDPKNLINGKLHIGKNVYFLGTANNDESTFAISDKVYDRSMILNLNKKARPFVGNKVKERKISNSDFLALKDKIVSNFKTSSDYKDLLKNINVLDSLLNQCFSINFGNRMINQIVDYVPIYVACGGTKEEAFDDFVSKKILRKLEAKDYLRLIPAIKLFKEKLDESFGKNNMTFSNEYLDKFLKM